MRLDRFSPNFDDAERLGLVDVRPVPPYRHIYALPGEALARLASFFTFGYREPRDVGGYVAGLEKKLRAWPGLFGKHDLFSVDRGEWLLVWDLRPVSQALVTALHGVDRVLYRACDTACDLRQLTRSVPSSAGGPITSEEVARRLEPLLERGLMVTDASRYLSLAIPLAEYSPPAPAVARFYGLVRAVGRKVPAGWIVSPEAARAAATRGILASSAGSGRRGRLHGRRAGLLKASQFSIDARGEVRIRRVPVC